MEAWRARGQAGGRLGPQVLPEALDVLFAHAHEEHDGVDPALDQVAHAADPRLQQAVLVLRGAKVSSLPHTRPSLLLWEPGQGLDAGTDSRAKSPKCYPAEQDQNLQNRCLQWTVAQCLGWGCIAGNACPPAGL